MLRATRNMCSLGNFRVRARRGKGQAPLRHYGWPADGRTFGVATFSFATENARGASGYRDKLVPGASVRLYLSNPSVGGGARTQKVTGVITQREVVSDARGTVIRITGADLGWHLMHNDAPLWFNLRGTTLDRLLEACIAPQNVFKGDRDPGWGFRGVRTSNLENRALKTRLRFTPGEREAFRQATLSGTFLWVQVQPGQKIADLLIMFARRLGFLVGVSADGWLQVWIPNYSQAPLYTVHYHDAGDRDANKNNVQLARRVDALDTIWTRVNVVGEKPYLTEAELAKKTFAPNVGKFRGKAAHDDALPFLHRLLFTDSEIDQHTADLRAEWRYQRGLFDAQTVTYQLRGHHQGGTWWESDTMCEVHDSVLGLDGNYYVASVQCQRDMQGGDTTMLTIKKPDLLGAVG